MNKPFIAVLGIAVTLFGVIYRFTLETQAGIDGGQNQTLSTFIQTQQRTDQRQDERDKEFQGIIQRLDNNVSIICSNLSNRCQK